jgi:predicted TIM-barrel fold metal-dependent hydrolase
MVLHTGYDLAYEKEELGAPVGVRRLHEAVPDLRLLACHMGGWRRWEESLAEVVGLPVYLETSYSLGQCPEELLLEIMDRHPDEYLLFGTDAPWADQAEELEKFLALPLADEVKRAALWENGHRFAGLEPPA